MEIANIEKTILTAPMPFTIEQDNSIEVIAGCNETLKCALKFIKMQLTLEANLISQATLNSYNFI
ncbi:MAG: hypothetical protein MTP17_02620 [Candidatus Midichloria sp.]|nr:MAG: hypothetical protein MTP17_02620 [Candidatus Midichloria sp.]